MSNSGDYGIIFLVTVTIKKRISQFWQKFRKLGIMVPAKLAGWHLHLISIIYHIQALAIKFVHIPVSYTFFVGSLMLVFIAK